MTPEPWWSAHNRGRTDWPSKYTCGYKKRPHVSEGIAFTNNQQVGEATLNVNMKSLALALSIMLLLAAGEALICHRCVPKQAGENCELTEEACKPGKDSCAAAKFQTLPFGQYQKCMALSDCQMLQRNSFIQIKCCGSDLCNTFDE
ncbi:uncharacterized protein ACBT44_019798 [Syngnathus typhle]